MQLVQRMDARMEALETRLSTLSLSQTPAATPPPLPEVISTQAFEALLAQPRLPPESRTLLTPLAKAFSRLSTILTPEELQEHLHPNPHRCAHPNSLRPTPLHAAENPSPRPCTLPPNSSRLLR